MRKIAYIFDIDGVLCRGPTVIPSAVRFLKNLAAQRIDFVLMTNGAGSTEVNKAKSLSKMFKTPIKSETIKIPQNAVSEFVVTSENIKTSRRIPKKALKGCCKGNVTG